MIESKKRYGGTEMTAEELYEKLKKIQKMKCESQTLELKTAKDGCRVSRIRMTAER